MIGDRLIQVLMCLAAVLWLSACGQEPQIRGESACMAQIEREIDSLVEAKRHVPIPLDPDCQSKECRIAERRYLAENEILMRIYEEHGDKFWRQGYVWGIGFGRVSLEGDIWRETGELSIYIYVSEKLEQELLPPEYLLPDRIDCVRLQVLESSPRYLLGDPNLSRSQRWMCLTWPEYEFCPSMDADRPMDGLK